MKKLFVIVLGVLICSASIAQVVKRGNLEIQAGTGFAFYSLTTNHEEEKDSLNAALAGLLRISVNYAVSEKYSIGLELERNGYATDEDSNESVRSINLFLENSFRLVNNEKFVLEASVSPGISFFRYTTFNRVDIDPNVNSTAFALKLGLTNRHYLGSARKVGLSYGLLYGGYYYRQFVGEGNDGKEYTWQTNDPLEDVTISFNGLHLNVGISYRIL